MATIGSIRWLSIGLCFLTLSSYPLFSRGSHDTQPPVPSGQPSQSILNVNNLTYWVKNDGTTPTLVNGLWNGRYPQMAPVGVLKSEGILWGGFVTDGVSPSLRVGGSGLYSDLTPGRIFTNSSGAVTGAEDPTSPGVRVYRVRPDWQTADLRDDAFHYYQTRELTAAMIAALRAQYQKDWNEWPAAQGAPFVDINGNGIYEPGIDIPGVFGADQTIWYVANDLDASKSAVYGVPPIGMEVQYTFWAYNRTLALSNTIFKRVKMIYKGTASSTTGARIDGMYMTQWVDPAVGDYFDDYVGCDSVNSAGFAYQGRYPIDRLYNINNMAAPAVAFHLLQGPIAPAGSGSRARFNNGYRYGYWNIPMTSFTYFGAGRQGGPDALEHNIKPYPSGWSFTGTEEWYNVMRGSQPDPPYPVFTPLKNIDSTSTRFELSGNPWWWSGYLDGNSYWYGERHFAMSSGPFSMARGDTQEVVFAIVAGLGTDYRNCFPIVSGYDQVAKSLADNLFQTPPPAVSVTPRYVNATTTNLDIAANAKNLRVTGISATLRKYDYSWVGNVQLYDDGVHRDTASGDGIWGNTVTSSPQYDGMHLDITANYANGSSMNWDHVTDYVTTAGPLNISSQVVSDNINQDGKVNPGENIRYTLAIHNSSAVNLYNIQLMTPNDQYAYFDTVRSLPAGSTDSMQYKSWDPTTYFSFTVPLDFPDPVYVIRMYVTQGFNRWTTDLRFPVVPYTQPLKGITMAHTGPGDWDLQSMIVDPAHLKSRNVYEITISDSVDPAWDKGFNLRNKTSNAWLLLNSQYPDIYGHNIPITEGFKVMRGDNFGNIGCRKDSTRWISSSPPWFMGYHYTLDDQAAFDGGVTTGYELPKYFQHIRTNFDPIYSVPVEVRFDTLVTQKAYRVMRTGPSDTNDIGPAYMLQSWPTFTNVPFTVWDVSDRAHPRQLTVAFRDQNYDGVWDPPIGRDDYEMIFIYYKTYDPSGSQFTYPPNAVIDELTWGAKADIMYQLGLAVRDGHRLNESSGTLYIRPWLPLSTKDVFTFNSSITGVADTRLLPNEFSLAQNYPNPFNPTTTIHYDIPRDAYVQLKIYNILGQEVANVVDGTQHAGRYDYSFNGNNLASGVYFYRITASGLHPGEGDFVSIKKMMLLK